MLTSSSILILLYLGLGIAILFSAGAIKRIGDGPAPNPASIAVVYLVCGSVPLLPYALKAFEFIPASNASNMLIVLYCLVFWIGAFLFGFKSDKAREI